MVTLFRNPIRPLTQLGAAAILFLAAPRPAPAGLKASYFSGRNFEVPVLERTDDRIEYRWEAQSPAPEVPVNDFSARWQGFVTAEFSGVYQLYVVSDNGSRLRLNGQVITDHFDPANGNQSGWFTGSYTFTAGQKVPVQIEYYESDGNAEITLYWESADQLFQVIPNSALTTGETPPPPAIGWTARYFDGRQFEKPVLTRSDAAIDFDWTGAPATGLFMDNFSAKWSGLLTAPFTGIYTFTTAADNGTRLWINGQLVLGAWNVVTGADGGWRSVEVALTAGQPVPILLDYYQAYGSASVALLWSGPGVPWEAVPGSVISALPAGTMPWMATLPNIETPAGSDVELPIQATDAAGATLSYAARGLPTGVTLSVESWEFLNPPGLPPVQTVSLSGRPWEPGIYHVMVSASTPSGTTSTNFTWKVTGPATDPGLAAALAIAQANLSITKNEDPARVTVTCVLPSGITSFYKTDLERSTGLLSWGDITFQTSFFALPTNSFLQREETLLFYQEAVAASGAAPRACYRIRLTPLTPVTTRRAALPIRRLPEAPAAP
jgi:hypothetical protein